MYVALAKKWHIMKICGSVDQKDLGVDMAVIWQS